MASVDNLLDQVVNDDKPLQSLKLKKESTKKEKKSPGKEKEKGKEKKERKVEKSSKKVEKKSSSKKMKKKSSKKGSKKVEKKSSKKVEKKREKKKRETKKTLLDKFREYCNKIHVESKDSDDVNEAFDKYEKDIEKDIKNLTKVKKVAKQKDPNAPKKNNNIFILYCNENRDEVKKNNPDMKSTEITTHLGKMWNEVKEKGGKDYQKYEKLAKKEKERYDKEMEGYKPPEGFEKTEKKSPRAKSGYVLWCNDNRKRIEEENFGDDWEGEKKDKFGAISKIMGKEWNEVKAENGSEYKKYMKMATEEKEGLKSKPSKNKKKKVEKKKVKEIENKDEEDEQDDDE
jgi:hypothetical protein